MHEKCTIIRVLFSWMNLIGTMTLRVWLCDPAWRNVGLCVWLPTVLVTMELPMRSAHAVIMDVMNQRAFATPQESWLLQ
jgi:hypothetical protein